MLTSSDKQMFEDQGFIRLDGLIPQADAIPSRELVLQRLADCGIDPRQIPRSSGIAAGAKLVKAIRKSDEFRFIVSPTIQEAVTELLGCETPPVDEPQLLFTLPNAETWELPHSVWHLDAPRLADFNSIGVQVFTFIDTVERGGGGTLIVSGSHRLLNNGEFIRSKHVKRKLKRAPWFRDLMSKGIEDRERFMNEAGTVDGVDVQVVELYGEPGDVYFVDLGTLHTLSPNISTRPRMMLTQRYFREECVAEIFGVGEKITEEA